MQRHARLLHRDSPHTGRGERARDQTEALGEAGRDEEILGSDPKAAGAAKVRGELDPEREPTLRAAVAECLVGGGRERAAECTEPFAAGERAGIRAARTQ